MHDLLMFSQGLLVLTLSVVFPSSRFQRGPFHFIRWGWMYVKCVLWISCEWTHIKPQNISHTYTYHQDNVATSSNQLFPSSQAIRSFHQTQNPTPSFKPPDVKRWLDRCLFIKKILVFCWCFFGFRYKHTNFFILIIKFGTNDSSKRLNSCKEIRLFFYIFVFSLYVEHIGGSVVHCQTLLARHPLSLLMMHHSPMWMRKVLISSDSKKTKRWPVCLMRKRKTKPTLHSHKMAIF